jgi:hypothetical protein
MSKNIAFYKKVYQKMIYFFRNLKFWLGFFKKVLFWLRFFEKACSVLARPTATRAAARATLATHRHSVTVLAVLAILARHVLAVLAR